MFSRTKCSKQFQTVKNPRGNPIPLYSVHANPANDFLICTAGKDKFVNVYDRRKLSDKNTEPVTQFCPLHLVSVVFFNSGFDFFIHKSL
jgi:hypothetical protein